MLRLNGDLIGFKMKPVSRDEFEAPLNRFSVKSCQIMATEDPRWRLFFGSGALPGLMLDLGLFKII